MAHLCKEQRRLIEFMNRRGYSNREIAAEIDVHPTTISRELKRNSLKGKYTAERAHYSALRRLKEKPKRKYFSSNMRAFVESHLEMFMSPEQISGLARERLGFCEFVSFQTIYNFINTDKKKGGLLFKFLVHGEKCYRRRNCVQGKRSLSKMYIDERPSFIEDRTRFGDFEIDTIVGKAHKSGLLTLNDRSTGFLFSSYTALNSSAVLENTVRLLSPLRASIHTITSDNGCEFAEYQYISKNLDIDFYFCHPGKSWQRGSNENLNGLIRRFFPKKYDFEDMNPRELNFVVNLLNARPRKRYGYYSPFEQLQRVTVN